MRSFEKQKAIGDKKKKLNTHFFIFFFMPMNISEKSLVNVEHITACFKYMRIVYR